MIAALRYPAVWRLPCSSRMRSSGNVSRGCACEHDVHGHLQHPPGPHPAYYCFSCWSQLLIRRISVHPANIVTYCSLRRSGEWRRDGPIYTSLSIQVSIFYMTDNGETPL
eukprot:1438319-Pleurochrysis_carterae.AAC.3